VFTDEMTARGTLLASEQLHRTETATRVRCWDGGDVMISDGPFAETAEQIAGLYIVECKDLDEAIEVAIAVPAAWYGTVEVRPVQYASLDSPAVRVVRTDSLLAWRSGTSSR
jgi:hypothetical protein